MAWELGVPEAPIVSTSLSCSYTSFGSNWGLAAPSGTPTGTKPRSRSIRAS